MRRAASLRAAAASSARPLTKRSPGSAFTRSITGTFRSPLTTPARYSWAMQWCRRLPRARITKLGISLRSMRFSRAPHTVLATSQRQKAQTVRTTCWAPKCPLMSSPECPEMSLRKRAGEIDDRSALGREQRGNCGTRASRVIERSEIPSFVIRARKRRRHPGSSSFSKAEER